MNEGSGEQMGGSQHGREGRWVCLWVCGGSRQDSDEDVAAQEHTAGTSSRQGRAHDLPPPVFIPLAACFGFFFFVGKVCAVVINFF